MHSESGQRDAARLRRSVAEPAGPHNHASAAVRADLERIRFSPYFSRLSAVTQVIPQASVGPVIHNRLTHSIKVTSVAREIAARLAANTSVMGERIRALGGCDPVVVQAAASAHDLGHPPFGHLGEQVLDRVARTRLGLSEGFEGNAQTFRILTELDTHGAAQPGLNLTAAVRAAVLKYPWTRLEWRDQHAELPEHERPHGVGQHSPTGAHKFSIYTLQHQEAVAALAASPGIHQWRQTLDCQIMDIADDIAYSIHDLDDFYRAGVLQQAAVSAEFRAWLGGQSRLALRDQRDLAARHREPGTALELVRRRILAKDPWIADSEAFRLSVQRVNDELVDGLLATPFDGGIDTERALSGFIRTWILRLQRAIEVHPNPPVRSGHVRLGVQAWHDVVVLKCVHSRFVLQHPDLAASQRGQAALLESLVLALHAWLRDPVDAVRAPRRLLESADSAAERYFALSRSAPDVLGDVHPGAGRGAPDVRELGRARAVIDYVASLTDTQARSLAASLRDG